MSEQPPLTIVDEPQPIPPTPPTPPHTTPPTNVLKILIIILAVTAVIAVIVMSYQLKKTSRIDLPIVPDNIENQEPVTQVGSSATAEPVALATADGYKYTQYYKNIVKQPGVEWFMDPRPTPDPQLLNTANSWLADFTLTYYQIGAYEGKPIIYAEIPCDGLCGTPDYILLIGTKESRARVIRRHSNYDFTSNGLSLQPGVTFDDTFIFSALVLDQVTYKNVTLKPGANSPWIGSAVAGLFSTSPFSDTATDPNKTRMFLADTAYGPLFLSYETNPESGTADYFYGIRTVGGFVSYFDDPIPYMDDDRVPKIYWNDGKQNTIPYRTDGLDGCGGGGPEIAVVEVPERDLTAVGKTFGSGTQKIVYNVTNPNHPLIQRVFKASRGIVFDYNNDTGESREYTITPAEFISQYGVLIIQDDFGNQTVLTNTKLGPQAECGKPVIYLYPEATTTITVSVDAQVTKSEPTYNNGWTVVAGPDGTLHLGNNTYTSLFWDGYGNGAYPTLTEGFVVRTDDALEAMAAHLRIMGFNEVEIKDFRDFWTPHLPTEPYTQFSWIQSAQMQQMAALTISPKPRTMIRAFVDYKGLAAPIAIAPQTIIPRTRKGYTVMEWGGLLHK